MDGLNEKVLLLTGASGGIGKATAELFHEAGARLLLADINEAAVQELASRLSPRGKRTIATKYDALLPDDATKVVDLCMRQFGQIDFLIPAAAIYEEAFLLDMTDDDWRKTMAINLDSVFYICRRAIRVMVDGGSIVLIASDAGHQGATPGHAHYGASKGGVLGLARSLARELAPRIRVNAISPGAIDTPMIADLMLKWGDSILSSTPMNRLGSPKEVASVAAFLCSAGASFMTGQSLHPNGGSYIGG